MMLSGYFTSATVAGGHSESREQFVNNFLPNTGQQQASIGGETNEEPSRTKTCINLLTGGLLVRVQPEEPIS
jgi:hypothetical protein